MSRSSEAHEIRSFQAQDVDQVVGLWQKCFRNGNCQGSAALCEYFLDIFLRHPWYDPELAPLVLLQAGEVAGFIGRMARPMTFRGENIRCAVATQLMVDPDRRLGFAALDLLRALHSGPQDLCYSDGANSQSLRVWERVGGAPCRLLSFEWSRPLRPIQNLFLSMRRHQEFHRLGKAGHPLSGVFDGIAARLVPRLYRQPQGRYQRIPASPGTILPLLQQVSSSSSLRPSYTTETLGWVLDRAGQAHGFGDMCCMLVEDAGGRPLGWFVYFVRAGDLARVLQVGALPGNEEAVVGELLCDAWEQKATSVTGQLDPLLTTSLSREHCRFGCCDLGVLVQSRNPALLAAIQSGDAFMSRLEGEWWMRFGIDRRCDW